MTIYVLAANSLKRISEGRVVHRSRCGNALTVEYPNGTVIEITRYESDGFWWVGNEHFEKLEEALKEFES